MVQEASWTVIKAFFDKNRLVRQQVDSFNKFMASSVQKIVEDHSPIQVQAANRAGAVQHHTLEFGQIYILKPTNWEKDGNTTAIMPNDARLRDLTYSSAVFVDITQRVHKDGQKDAIFKHEKVCIGKIPIMLRSSFCRLNGLNDQDLYKVNECPQDPGGYFIVGGLEKAVIAQETLACNTVFVFDGKDGKFTHQAEIRSLRPNNNLATLHVNLKLAPKPKPNSQESPFGQQIVAKLQCIKEHIPIVVFFRALGCDGDADILHHINCDPEMKAMIEPSLYAFSFILDKNHALDYIGTRTASPGDTREKRIQNARGLLEKHLLPHIGVTDDSNHKKACFLGYMVHRLMMVALGRRQLDDRDHYGNKRLDLAGALMAEQFRTLFRQLTNEVRLHCERSIKKEGHFHVEKAVNNRTITDGLRIALATGNFGKKIGVSQVLNRLTYTATQSHLQRVNASIPQDSPLTRPRQLQ